MKSSIFGVVSSCSLDRPALLGEGIPSLPEGADPDDAARAGSAFPPVSFGLAGAPGVAVEFVELSLLRTSAGFPVSSAKIAGTRRKVLAVNVAMMRVPNFIVLS
jgi:hypothetical protein